MGVLIIGGGGGGGGSLSRGCTCWFCSPGASDEEGLGSEGLKRWCGVEVG